MTEPYAHGRADGPSARKEQRRQALALITSGECPGVSSAAVRLNLPRAEVLAYARAAGLCDEDGTLLPSDDRRPRASGRA